MLDLRSQLLNVVERNSDALLLESTLTLFMNTDGATPFRSAKKTFWPFWVIIDNLPNPRRAAFENMMLIALWKGSSKPDFSVIGPMIGEELNEVLSGVYSNKLSKHFAIEFKDYICDMVAKAPSLNVVQFNGYNGCVYCDMRGVHENHRHIYPCLEPFSYRSAEQFRRDADLAEKSRTTINGIKGRCFLDKFIKIPEDVPIDAMHQVFLGCGKSISTALISSLSKRDLAVVEKRLGNIQSPRNSHGKPKPLSELSFWKARDFKFFLFHYGIYCLRDFVREDLLQSFGQLSIAMRLLSMQEINERHIFEAEQLLGAFGKNFAQLYGSDSQSFNFHSLRHLCDQVRRKGPLWRNSAFVFESANHFLLSSVQGTRKSLSHVVDNFVFRQNKYRTRVSSQTLFDDRFTELSEECRKFAFIECGPGEVKSRHFFHQRSETLASLSYKRLGGNWSECLTRLTSNEFVVAVAYHCDSQSTSVIVRKYRAMTVKSFIETPELFFCYLGELDDHFSVVAAKDFVALRVIVLSGNLESCLISLMKEGFDHN